MIIVMMIIKVEMIIGKTRIIGKMRLIEQVGEIQIIILILKIEVGLELILTMMVKLIINTEVLEILEKVVNEILILLMSIIMKSIILIMKKMMEILKMKYLRNMQENLGDNLFLI